MNETVYALYESAENLGLLFVLKPFGKNIKVSLPISNGLCDKPISDLDLGASSANALTKCGIYTVWRLIDAIMTDKDFLTATGLDKKSISQLMTLLLVMAYEELNDREKLTFWHDFVRNNAIPDDMIIGGASNA